MKLNEKMFLDIANGTAIIIDSETGVYYSMNTYGTNLLIKILGGENIQNEFVEKLKNAEIITDGTQIPLGFEITGTDETAPVLYEYTNMREALLVDPIHEVDSKMGWTPC